MPQCAGWFASIPGSADVIYAINATLDGGRDYYNDVGGGW
jgi:hypothetical protein